MSDSLRARIPIIVAASLAVCAILTLTAWTLWPLPTIEDIGGSRIVLEMDRDGPRRQDVTSREGVDQSIWIIARRLRELAIANARVRPDGEDRIVIDLAGATNPQDSEKLAKIISKTGKLEFRLVDTTASSEDAPRRRIRREDDLLYQTVGSDKRPMLVKKQALVDGADLIDAQAIFDSLTREPMVIFKFNSDGARKFGRATQENVDRPFAIVLDNEVLSAPIIREPILGGSGQIQGGFTVESASNMAMLLRTGALPVSFKLVEIRQLPPASAGH